MLTFEATSLEIMQKSAFFEIVRHIRREAELDEIESFSSFTNLNITVTENSK